MLSIDHETFIKPEHLPSLEQRAKPIATEIHVNYSLGRLCRERGLEDVRSTGSGSTALIIEAMYDERSKPEILEGVLHNLDKGLSLDKLKRELPHQAVSVPPNPLV